MDDGCFSGLLKLNNLDLSENKIEILDTPVFNPLHNLVNLNISNNKIK